MRLRRRRIALVFALFGLAAPAAPAAMAQEPARAPASPPAAVPLEGFRLSGPPALALTGTSSSAINRPNTPRDLIASLVSGAGSDGIVPDGYAIETAPYWLARKRTLTLRDYYQSSLADRLRYFTAVSVATSRERARDTIPANAHAAIAVRTLLVNGRPGRSLIAAGDSIRAQQLAYIEQYRRWENASSRATGLEARRSRLVAQENLLSSLVTHVLVGEESSLRDSTMRTLARRDSLRSLVIAGEAAAAEAAKLDDEMTRIETKLASLASRFAAAEVEPTGFILEIAAGTRSVFGNASWARRRTDGLAAWITPMYRHGSQGFEIIGVARYMSDVRDYSGRNLFDVGARTGIDVGKGSLSAEHVWRSVHGPAQSSATAPAQQNARNRTTRWAVLFDYPLGGRLWAAASFGTDYRQPRGERPVIATIGLNLGLGAIEIIPAAR